MKNDEMNLAWQFVKNTGTSIFLTGKAGTGKTTFLRALKDKLPKRMVVVAPTGIAASNCLLHHTYPILPLKLREFLESAKKNSASYERSTYW